MLGDDARCHGDSGIDVVALGQHPDGNAELLGRRDDDGVVGFIEGIEIEQHGRVLC